MGGRGSSSASSMDNKSVSESSNLQTDHLYKGDYFLTTDDSSKIIQNTLGVSEAQAYEYWRIVTNYTGQWYGSVRAYQRTGSGSDTAKEISKGVENFIKVSPKWDGGTTYRGIQDVSDNVFDALTTPGTVFDMRGTSSWSSSKSVAADFAGSRNNSIIFSVEKGQSKGTSIRHISQYVKEDEILVSKNAKYEVVTAKENKKKGYTEVTLREI